MKELKKYKKNGYDFDVVERVGKYAISKGTCKGGGITWEVFEVLSHNGLTFRGVKTEPAEHTPSNKQWGSKGWTYRSIEMAKDKLGELLDS